MGVSGRRFSSKEVVKRNGCVPQRREEERTIIGGGNLTGCGGSDEVERVERERRIVRRGEEESEVRGNLCVGCERGTQRRGRESSGAAEREQPVKEKKGGNTHTHQSAPNATKHRRERGQRFFWEI